MQHIMVNLNLAKTALASLLEAGAEKAQSLASFASKYEMNVENGELSLIRTTDDVSLSLTALRENRKGASSVNRTDAASVKTAACEALEFAGASAPDTANDISEASPSAVLQAGPETPDRDRMYARLHEFLTCVSAEHPKISLNNIYFSHNLSRSRFVNSNGVDLSSTRGYYSFSVMLMGIDGGKSSSFNYTGFTGYDLDRPLADCGSVRALLTQTAEQVETRPVSGKFEGDVIFTPDCLDSVLDDYIYTFLSDGPLISGTSILKGSLGQAVASPLLTLRCMPESLPGGYFITGDGYRAENSVLIDGGVLQSFVLGLYGSKKTGFARAKNAGGAYVVDAGETPYADMVKSVKRGLLVCRFSGGSPAQNGDLTGVAKNSYYIEDGEIKYPVSETMIAGNLNRMLRGITAVSAERIDFGGGILPYASVSGMTIVGK